MAKNDTEKCPPPSSNFSGFSFNVHSSASFGQIFLAKKHIKCASNRTYLASSDDGGDGKQQSSKASKSSKKRQRQKLLKEQHQKQEGGSLPQPQAMAHQSSQNNTATIKNDLKSGPQVLIKNVNGKVVITPIPETQNPPEPASLPATNNMNVKAMPQAVVRSAVGNGVTSAKARTAAAHGGKVVEKDVRNNNNQNAATNNLTNGGPLGGGGLGVGNQVTQSNQQTSQRTKKASLGDQNIDDFSK